MAAEIRKQISLFLPLSDWRLLRQEAARRRVPLTALVAGWIEGELQRLRDREGQPRKEDED